MWSYIPPSRVIIFTAVWVYTALSRDILQAPLSEKRSRFKLFWTIPSYQWPPWTLSPWWNSIKLTACPMEHYIIHYIIHWEDNNTNETISTTFGNSFSGFKTGRQIFIYIWKRSVTYRFSPFWIWTFEFLHILGGCHGQLAPGPTMKA